MALLELPDDYDLDHLQAAMFYMKNYRTAIDGGAHQGIWTREMLKLFNSVSAFEPVESNREKLPDESINFHYGLGQVSENRVMAPGKKNTGQWHVASLGIEQVEIIPLDSLEIPSVDFIKLDLEGYELFALKGAEVTTKVDKPVILIEENGLNKRYMVRDDACKEYLESLGYRRREQVGQDSIYVHRSR